MLNDGILRRFCEVAPGVDKKQDAMRIEADLKVFLESGKKPTIIPFGKSSMFGDAGTPIDVAKRQAAIQRNVRKSR
jgi:hypothetical protein